MQTQISGDKPAQFSQNRYLLILNRSSSDSDPTQPVQPYDKIQNPLSRSTSDPAFPPSAEPTKLEIPIAPPLDHITSPTRQYTRRRNPAAATPGHTATTGNAGTPGKTDASGRMRTPISQTVVELSPVKDKTGRADIATAFTPQGAISPTAVLPSQPEDTAAKPPLKRASSNRRRTTVTSIDAAQIIGGMQWERFVSRTSVFKVLTLSFMPLAESSLNQSALNAAANVAVTSFVYFTANLAFDLFMQRIVPYCIWVNINGERQRLGNTYRESHSKGSLKEAVLESLDVLPILIAGKVNDLIEAEYFSTLLIAMPVASLLLTLSWRYLSQMRSERSVLFDSALRGFINLGLLAVDLYMSPSLSSYIDDATLFALSYCAITLVFTGLLTFGISKISNTACARGLGVCTRNLSAKTAHLICFPSYGAATPAERTMTYGKESARSLIANPH